MAQQRLRDTIGSDIFETKDVLPSVVTQTGMVSLDISLGGGLPSGLVEVFGPPGVGKTAFAGQVMAYGQRAGLAVCLVAAEYLDEPYFRRLGVNTGRLPTILGGDEDVEDLMLSFLDHHERAMLVIDSVNSLRPENEEPGDWNEMMFDLFHRFKECMSVRSCVLMTSHVRKKRSIDPQKMFAGGTNSASIRLADLCSVRLGLEADNVSDEGLDYNLVVNIVANTLAKPAQLVELPARKGYGVDIGVVLLRTAVELGHIKKEGGSWYRFKGTNLGQGEKNVARVFSENHALQHRLISDLIEG